MAEPRRWSGLILRTLGFGNLLGALLSFFYFRFIDPTAAEIPRVGAAEITYSIIAFALLVLAGVLLGRWWAGPLLRWNGPERVAPAAIQLVRRRALQLPYALAGISGLGWLLAGVLWGIVWPALTGTLAPHRIVRSIFGNTVIAGGVTCTFIFFTVEHAWRRRLPRFFPDGDLSAVQGVPRFPVRARLLAIFLLVSVVPLSLLAVLSYTRSLALLEGGPASQAFQVVGGAGLEPATPAL